MHAKVKQAPRWSTSLSHFRSNRHSRASDGLQTVRPTRSCDLQKPPVKIAKICPNLLSWQPLYSPARTDSTLSILLQEASGCFLQMTLYASDPQCNSIPQEAQVQLAGHVMHDSLALVPLIIPKSSCGGQWPKKGERHAMHLAVSNLPKRDLAGKLVSRRRRLPGT